MSSQTAFLDDAESLDRSRETARLGVALVRLENLSYQPPEGRPRIPLQPRKTEYWLKEFRLRRYFPNVCGNRIKAEISQPVLVAALARSELTISNLQDAGHIKRLHLPEGALLTHYHGQHRLEAAKQHIYPHNEWWAVELYDKEQDRNIESILYDDGTVFRFLDAELDWRTAWRSKDAENDLKAMEKRPALYKGFTSLRPFVGLWASFQKGTLHRYKSLRCDEVGIIPLHVWTSILDGDEELMYNLDPETVELFEGRAPKTLSADRDFITRAIESKSAFPLLYNDVKRLGLLQNVIAIDGMIPSIKTLAKDSLYLEDCAKAMRTLIDLIECHIKEAIQHMWRGYGGDYIVLKSADGLTEYSDTRTGDDERFEIAILNADADREHARNMLTIARPPGRYDYDLESEITGHCQLLTRISGRQQELLRPPVWTTTLSNVKVKQRYGRPHNQALQDCAPYFFLHNICEIPESSKYVTNLFIKRGIALSFFRIPLLPPEAGRHGNRMEGTHQATSQAQTSRSVRDATQDAALTSRLEECERQVAEQQSEISLYKVKLSEAQTNSERLLAEVQPYRNKIEELETINLDQSRENS
ncbi:uncharacterized protein PAC_18360 [Phialocephala subalpina]|uniref:Uncharacterized protein n=1 Tax=Phialocephala subalpina TaxID=576137 RepID=A0A1L7XTT5_9HELO|nr:uncharacterized protein PAC_18360 [Phialocephala subalpina]